MTLAELAEEYLAQHDGQPETTAKLRWLLSKSTAVFGSTPLTELDAREIAAWRMTLPTGHRFKATQALRQTLARAVEWGLIDTNPAKTGVDNPQPPRREMHPFDSDAQLDALAAELGPRYGPTVLFAAATGLRPGEWIALEHRDIDLNDLLVHVCRAFRVNRLKPTKTNTARAVPLQRSALDALDQLRSPPGATSLLFPAPEDGHLDLHNWRGRHWRPAQRAAGITATRRLYDLRHTFATVALAVVGDDRAAAREDQRKGGERLSGRPAPQADSVAHAWRLRQRMAVQSDAQLRAGPQRRVGVLQDIVAADRQLRIALLDE
jgi:integrase